MPTTDAASFAKYRLERLERPHDIAWFQAGDETVLCGVCGFGLVGSGKGARHDPEEVARERRAARRPAGPLATRLRRVP